MVQVDVVSLLQCLLPCTRLKRLTIEQDWQVSRQCIDGVSVSVPVCFAQVAMPWLHTLEIPTSPACLDLQGCPLLCSLHVMHVFKVNPPDTESLACVTVGLRNLSKMFKMPHNGVSRYIQCPVACTRLQHTLLFLLPGLHGSSRALQKLVQVVYDFIGGELCLSGSWGSKSELERTDERFFTRRI